MLSIRLSQYVDSDGSDACALYNKFESLHPKAEKMGIDEFIFSSDATRSIAKISAAFAGFGDLDDALSAAPDYGLHVSTVGNNVFCTLLDKGRRIVVRESLGNQLSGRLSYNTFRRSLERALKEAGSAGEGLNILSIDMGNMEKRMRR